MDIFLENGGVATVDECDAHLGRYVWSRVDRTDQLSYAVRRDPNNNYRQVRMHREVMGFPAGPVDHKNGNGLDNRRANLRVCSQTENARNVSGPTAKNTTGFRGVSFIPSTGRFRARISDGNKKISLGVYDTAEEANAARLSVERGLWGVTPRRAKDHEGVDSVGVNLQTRPNWTKEDDAVLVKNARKGAKFVALSVGRTTKAVYGRAQTLGVRLRPLPSLN